MGLMFVIIFWGFAGVVLAAVVCLVSRLVTSHLTSCAHGGALELLRKRAIRYATFLPFACLAWAATVFIAQGVINEIFLHRDIGLGDSWYCPLPNGYSILMIDVTDSGTVYNPKTQISTDDIGDQQDAISGVKELQVAGRYLLGGFDSQYAKHFGDENSQADHYFLLDTQTGKRRDFNSQNELILRATDLGIKVSMEPVNKVYSRYRFTWFDLVVLCILLLPPFVVYISLARSIIALRRSHNPSELSGGDFART